MSETVENVSEQQNSALSSEAAQSAEAANKEITNNVEEAVPDTVKTATSQIGEESLQKPSAEESSTSPTVDHKKSPVKRHRISFIERAQKESEELVRTLGGSLEMEGGRKTRSSTRGTPTRSAVVSTPPPAKKSRASPASGASTPTRGRGRGRKIETTTDGSAEEESSPTTSKKKTPAKGRKAASKGSLEGHQATDKKDVEESERKSDDDSTLVTSTKSDNVDSATTSEVVSAETKTIEGLEQAGIESNEDTLSGEVETENKLDKEGLKNEDKTDAVLEPVVEETQSQIAVETNTAEEIAAKEPVNVSHIEKVQEKYEENDSAMETEEIKPEKNDETEKHSVENTSSIKELKVSTSEPIDVDSSSNSNEALEKMEVDISENLGKSQILTPAENVEQTSKDVESNSLIAEAQPSSTNASNINDVNTVEENIKQKFLVTDEGAAPTSEITDSNTIGAKLLNEPTAAAKVDSSNKKSTEETTTVTHNDLNKTENDLCEPKIATSPPISAAKDNSGTVTTP